MCQANTSWNKTGNNFNDGHLKSQDNGIQEKKKRHCYDKGKNHNENLTVMNLYATENIANNIQKKVK